MSSKPNKLDVEKFLGKQGRREEKRELPDLREKWHPKETTRALELLDDRLTGKYPATRHPRKCTHPMYVRDGETNKIVYSEGRPVLLKDQNGDQVWCERWAIAGGFVCPKHGGNLPTVKKRAQERLMSLVDDTIDRLVDLRDQNDHMPTALGASAQLLNRALGKPGDAAKDKGSRAPQVIVGVAIAGIPAKIASVSVRTSDDDDTGTLDADYTIE